MLWFEAPLAFMMKLFHEPHTAPFLTVLVPCLCQQGIYLLQFLQCWISRIHPLRCVPWLSTVQDASLQPFLGLFPQKFASLSRSFANTLVRPVELPSILVRRGVASSSRLLVVALPCMDICFPVDPLLSLQLLPSVRVLVVVSLLLPLLMLVPVLVLVLVMVLVAARVPVVGPLWLWVVVLVLLGLGASIPLGPRTGVWCAHTVHFVELGRG